jgi:hypothetical protein
LERKDSDYVERLVRAIDEALIAGRKGAINGT